MDNGEHKDHMRPHRGRDRWKLWWQSQSWGRGVTDSTIWNSMCFYHLKRLQKVVLLGQINIKTNKMRQKAKGRPVRLTPFSVLNTVTYNLKSPVNLEFTVSLKRCSIIFFFHQKLLSMCSSTYIFFTRNHYLKCTTSLLSPTSAISMRPTFKVYVQSLKWIFIWIKYLRPTIYLSHLMSVQIFWPPARKPLSNLGAQIGGGQIDYGAEFEHFGSKNVAMGRSFCWGWWWFEEDVRMQFVSNP